MFYNYICHECGYQQEEQHGMTEEPTIICPTCNTQMAIKIYGGSGVHYKGGGWAGKPAQDASRAKRVTRKVSQEQINGE